MLNVSRQTLYRRLGKFNIPTSEYAAISPNELADIVKSIKANFPNDGEVMVQGHMLQRGIKVQRVCLRSAIHHVDHDNTVLRRSNLIKR